MVSGLRSALVVGVSALALLVPSTAHAEGERQAQWIEFAPIPDFFVGQFVEVHATASSGLPVTLSVEGDCQLRDLPGAANSLLVATGAGTCTVWADQPGDEEYDPAVRTGRDVGIIQSEVDLAVTTERVIEPGNPLPVHATVRGEHGDDPLPTGNVRYTVKNADGEEIEARENVMAGDGESMVEFPEASTVNWPPGFYYVYAWYLGDSGYYATRADGVRFAVARSGGAGASDADMKLLVTPDPPVRQGMMTLTLTGFPDGIKDAKGEFMVHADRVLLSPKLRPVDGKVSWSYPQPKLGAKPLTVELWGTYSWEKDGEFVYKDLPYTYVLKPGYNAALTPLPPIDSGRVKVTEKGTWAIDASVEAPPEPMPYVNTYGRCLASSSPDRIGRTWRWRIAGSTDCSVTIGVAASEDFPAASFHFDVKARSGTAGAAVPEQDGLMLTDPRAPMAGRTLVLDGFPPNDPDVAPAIDAVIDEPVHLRVPWPAVGETVKVAFREGGKWKQLGSSVVGADGFLSVPPFVATARGPFVMRFADSYTSYVNVVGKPPCPSDAPGSCDK